MAQAEAFCEEHGRNITLEEARILFFAQPKGERKRFTFRCGDPRCRAMLQPKVAAALYNREPTDHEKNLRSPYFREIAAHRHIQNCTWTNGAPNDPSDQHTDRLRRPSNPIVADLGLVLKLKPRKRITGEKPIEAIREPAEDDHMESEVDVSPTTPHGTRNRAETSRFMATVAMRYLGYTDHQRRTTELTLEGIVKASFYDICMPINAFHPYYQNKRIYHGEARIIELTNVFFIRFLRKLSPEGEKSKRTTVAEIKLGKKWLEQNDRALAAVLMELASSARLAWCFFYTTEPVEIKNERAQFFVKAESHIAVIDQDEIELVSATAV